MHSLEIKTIFKRIPLLTYKVGSKWKLLLKQKNTQTLLSWLALYSGNHFIHFILAYCNTHNHGHQQTSRNALCNELQQSESYLHSFSCFKRMINLVFTMLFHVVVNILLPSLNPYAFMLMAVSVYEKCHLFLRFCTVFVKRSPAEYFTPANIILPL